LPLTSAARAAVNRRGRRRAGGRGKAVLIRLKEPNVDSLCGRAEPQKLVIQVEAKAEKVTDGDRPARGKK
jgi:hypothetical protein